MGAAVSHHRHDDTAGREVAGEARTPRPAALGWPPACSPPPFLVQIKCDQYWPNRGTETYGFIQVALLDTIELATFCVRTFSLHKVGPGRGRPGKWRLGVLLLQAPRLASRAWLAGPAPFLGSQPRPPAYFTSGPT